MKQDKLILSLMEAAIVADHHKLFGVAIIFRSGKLIKISQKNQGKNPGRFG